jgi:Putative beta barrel porin-7 (BBP7)
MVEDAEENALVVNRATRWIGLIMMTTLLARSVAAEELPFPDPDGLDLPQDSMLFGEEPMPTGDSSPGYDQSQSAENYEPSVMVPSSQSMQPSAGMPMGSESQFGESYDGGSYDGPYDGQPYDGRQYPMGPQYFGGDMQPDCYRPWDGQPAPIESSGTWLNRGLWYAEADVLLIHRNWQKSDQLLAFENSNQTNRLMILQAGHPGGDAGVRATLGRFLFRDDQNRDHTAEFTAFSLGEFVSDISLGSITPNNLFIPSTLTGDNPSFDGSSQQRVIYSSQFNSFELNYHLKSRLGRDQMVMDPNGHWRRESGNGFRRNYLAGIRLMTLRETLNWTAEDILVNGANGQYLITTDNNLVGFQMGAGIEYETGRWSVGVSAKTGFYVNDANARSLLNFTADDADDFDRSNTEDQLAWMGEAHVLSRYHVTQNFSVRAGLDILTLDSLALAPRQINFISDTSQIETTGNPWYMGCSLGFDCYW